MSDLVGNPEDRFSRVEAQIIITLCLCLSEKINGMNLCSHLYVSLDSQGHVQTEPGFNVSSKRLEKHMLKEPWP